MRLAPATTRTAGFTLVELLVVLTVLAVLAAVATPSMSRIVAAQRVRAMAADLHLALVQARSEAIKRNAAVTLSPAGGDWNDGWVVLDPENTEGTPLRAYTGGRGVQVTTTTTQVVYVGSGRSTLATEASFMISSTATDEARCVLVNLTGRPYVKTAAAC